MRAALWKDEVQYSCFKCLLCCFIGLQRISSDSPLPEISITQRVSCISRRMDAYFLKALDHRNYIFGMHWERLDQVHMSVSSGRGHSSQKVHTTVTRHIWGWSVCDWQTVLLKLRLLQSISAPCTATCFCRILLLAKQALFSVVYVRESLFLSAQKIQRNCFYRKVLIRNSYNLARISTCYSATSDECEDSV